MKDHEAEQPGVFASAVMVAAIALALRLLCTWWIHGLSVVDVASFESWASQFLEEKNAYLDTVSPANYPPPWIWLCGAVAQLARAMGISFDLCLRILYSLADACTAAGIVYAVSCHTTRQRLPMMAGLAYALNPVTILVGIFHGQNEPLVVGLLVMAACVTSTTHSKKYLISCLLIGLSLSLKPIGVIFAPWFLLHQRSVARVFYGAGLMVAPCLTWAIYLPDIPALESIVRSYGSPTDFGFFGLANSWTNIGHGSLGAKSWTHVPWEFKTALPTALVISFWFLRKRTLWRQLTLSPLIVYLTYPTLGANYLAWLFPFLTVDYFSSQSETLGSKQVGRLIWATTLLSAMSLVAFYDAHHPVILTGDHLVRAISFVTLPQMNALFFFSHAALVYAWARLLVALIRAPPESG